jgi:hypothetical protein
MIFPPQDLDGIESPGFDQRRLAVTVRVLNRLARDDGGKGEPIKIDVLLEIKMGETDCREEM